MKDTYLNKAITIFTAFLALSLCLLFTDAHASASDVNVRTFTRNALRFDLLGRPRPHGRASSPDRFAASLTARSHVSEGGAA